MARKPKKKEVEDNSASIYQHPQLATMARTDIEEHIERVQSIRMVAAIEYAEGQNIKLSNEANKYERQLLGHFTQLAKEIERARAVEEALRTRLNKIDGLKDNLGLVRSMIISTDDN